jgi:hypothetical protein
MYCTNCGQKNANGARLCQRCGAVMGSKEVKGGKGEDVAGFLLGLFLLPLAYLVWTWGSFWADHEALGSHSGTLTAATLLTTMVTLVAACLFIPARHYEKPLTRRVGFVGGSLSAGLCVAAIGGFVACIVLQVLEFTDNCTEIEYLFFPLVYGGMAASAAALFWACTYVLMKKTGLMWSRVSLGASVVLALSAICIAIAWCAGK